MTAVLWLGDQYTCRAGWQVTELKHLAFMRSGEGITSEGIEQIGAYPVYGGNGLRGFASTYTHDGNFPLVGRQGALCGNVHLASGRFYASEHAIVVRPIAVEPRWLAYLLASMNLGQYSMTTAQPGIGVGQIGAIPVPVPPSVTQTAIADYLDRETAQIDALIKKQRQLIATLGERRLAIRSASFTSIVGTGDRLKWALSEIDQRAGSAADDLPLLSVSITWGVRRRDESTSAESRAEDLFSYKVCEPGDLVINRMRAFQGAIGVAPETGIVSPDYAVMRIRSGRADAGWLGLLMCSTPFIAQMTSRIRGIGGTDAGNVRTPRINVADLLDIRVDMPSFDTQIDLLAGLLAQSASITSIVGAGENFIALATERRAALITAAVTGQIDVGAAA